MSIQDSDPLHRIAQQVADCIAGSGYAFIEDDQLDGLTAMLRSFLAHAADPAQLDVAATALDEARPGRASG